MDMTITSLMQRLSRVVRGYEGIVRIGNSVESFSRSTQILVSVRKCTMIERHTVQDLFLFNLWSLLLLLLL